MNIHSAIIQAAKTLDSKSFLTPYLDSELLMTKAIKKIKNIF